MVSDGQQEGLVTAFLVSFMAHCLFAVLLWAVAATRYQKTEPTEVAQSSTIYVTRAYGVVASRKSIAPKDHQVFHKTNQRPLELVHLQKIKISTNVKAPPQQQNQLPSTGGGGGGGNNPGTGPSVAALDALRAHNPAPPYPRLSRLRREEGRVLLSLVVQSDGSVSTVRVEESSGYELLDRAALDAVKNWDFSALVTAQKGTSDTRQLLLPFRFSLTSLHETNTQ